jgi:rhamnosyltransferase subunit B
MAALGLGVPNQSPNPLVIVATSGTGGDILPFIVLSQALQERGHRILMLLPRFHESLALASGVPYQTFGTHDEWQALLNNPDLWDERKSWGVIWSGLVPHLDAMRDLMAQLPANDSCVVLSHPILVPMAALARSVLPDLRIVAGYLAPSNLCSSHDMLAAGSLRVPSWIPVGWKQALWRQVHKGWVDPVTLPGLNAARRQNSLPPVAHFFEHILKAPNASLGLFPSWYASVQPDWPEAFFTGDFVSTKVQSRALSPELQRFLSDGTPPIVFTPGTGHQHASRFFTIALRTLERLGRRGLFITPHAAQLPDPLPSSVMWQAHVPFTSLLPLAAAVVHHSGMGTTAEAFRGGTPQLIVPFAFDQFDNGLRAKRLGVAEVLPAKRLSVGRMQKKLAHLLVSHDVLQSCSAVAQKMVEKSEVPCLLDWTEAALLEVPLANASGDGLLGCNSRADR